MRDDHCRLLEYRFRLFACLNELRNIMTIHFEHVPTECLVLLAQWLERHDGLRITVDLNIVAIDDSSEVAEAIRTEGSCFTFPSPLLLALEEALRLRHDYAPLGNLVRQRLREIGIEPMVDGPVAAPVVTTFVPPQPGFLARCNDLGYRIGGESGYLAARGLVQIATMGAVLASQINSLFDQLA